MMGDVAEEDSEIEIKSGVQVLSPQAVFRNDYENSLIAGAAIPVLSTRSSNPFNRFFPLVLDGALFFVIDDDMGGLRL